MDKEIFTEIRFNLNLTQQELADELGLTRERISNFETGSAYISKRIELALWCLAYESFLFKVGDRAKRNKKGKK